MTRGLLLEGVGGGVSDCNTVILLLFFFFSSRRRHTRLQGDWSSDVCSSDLLTLLVVLLGVPPAGVFTFFLAGAVAKHMTHAVPTALLGIPGDTLATPLLQDANMLRKLGVPHIALRKMVSGGIVAAFVAVPLAVLFAVMLAPFGSMITKTAPWIFLAAALLIAYFSAGPIRRASCR